MNGDLRGSAHRSAARQRPADRFLSSVGHLARKQTGESTYGPLRIEFAFTLQRSQTFGMRMEVGISPVCPPPDRSSKPQENKELTNEARVYERA